jgi:transglutaminase-like putative cysteine protease
MIGGAQVFSVVHTTVYEFDHARRSCDVVARLEPRNFERQHVCAARVTATPRPLAHLRVCDRWSNPVDHFKFGGPLTELRLASHSLITVHAERTMRETQQQPTPFVSAAPEEACRPAGAIWRWAAQCLPDADVAPADIEALCRLIRRDFAYDPRETAISLSVSEIFANCRGVCQDFSSLAIAVLRARRLTCRFNIGYLLRGVSMAPRSIALHAWFSVWFADRGWIDFDPLAPGTLRITLATGQTQADIPPVAGFAHGRSGRQCMRADIVVNLSSSGDPVSGEGVQQQTA